MPKVRKNYRYDVVFKRETSRISNLTSQLQAIIMCFERACSYGKASVVRYELPMGDNPKSKTICHMDFT